ncbi:MAG: AAA family ATPase [Niabella sp.]
MKILAIRIKNLASLEGITEIDFTKEPLSSAGIFAITGPTGSGKTTILDALCLALYAKTPRYAQAREQGIELRDVNGNSIKQNDTRGILRDGTADGFAEVDFRSIDGQDYRATWSVRRARNKADGSLQDYHISLKNLSTRTDIPGRKNETLQQIERLIGLNFEQFTRSVLLAQGDFTAFLKADKDEKSSLLEKLTGTSIYSEISSHIFERAKEEEQRMESLAERKGSIATLTDTEITELEAQGEELQSEINELNLQKTKVQDILKWHEQTTNLKENLSHAETFYQQAFQDKETAKERQAQLVLIEKIQPIRPLTENLARLEQELAEQKAETESLKAQQESLHQEKGKLTTSLQEATEALSIARKNLADAEPLLQQARALDILLEKSEESIHEERQSVLAIENKIKTLDEEQKNMQETAAQLASEIKKLESWQTANQARAAIAENHNLIANKLSDAQKWVNEGKQIQTEIENISQNIEKNKKEVNDRQAQIDLLQTEIEKARKAYQKESDEIAKMPFEKWQQEKEETNIAIEIFREADLRWKDLYGKKEALQTIVAKQQGCHQKLTKAEALLEETAASLVKSEIRQNTSRQMLDKARLESAADVVSLRAQLTENTPCPVCGSTMHPYAMHAVENMLNALEKEYDLHRKSHEDTFKQHSTLQGSIEQLKADIRQLDIDSREINETIFTLSLTWEKSDIGQESKDIDEANKTEWIQQQINGAKEKLHTLEAQIGHYHLQKSAAEKLRDMLYTQEQKLQSAKEQSGKLLNHIALTEREKQHLITRAEQLNADLSDIEKLLTPHFSSTDWVTKWRENPTGFLQSVHSFAKIWQEKTASLADKQGELKETAQKAGFLKQQIDTAREELSLQTAKAAHLAKQHSLLEQERKALFNGEDCTLTESKLKSIVQQAEESLKNQEQQYTALELRIAQASTELKHIVSETQQITTERFDVRQRLDKWLQEHNNTDTAQIGEETLQGLLQFSHEWIAREREEIKTITEALTKADTVLAERKRALAEHLLQQTSEQTQEDLAQQLSLIHESLTQKTQESNEVFYRLRTDKHHKSQISELLAQINAQQLIAENWSRLNSLVGSADGKKFRQIAQEYTLDVLLHYANQHLSILSKRYQLQRVPDTLALQVVDGDMGDEVRTVYSLSGGESFLVSLALALGLASLSSNRMQVESLFIDEGFGSLDPQTLIIAMDALERLQNQGRKVGVISHVQDMTERIPVQIQVHRHGSGRSVVEVVG